MSHKKNNDATPGSCSFCVDDDDADQTEFRSVRFESECIMSLIKDPNAGDRRDDVNDVVCLTESYDHEELVWPDAERAPTMLLPRPIFD